MTKYFRYTISGRHTPVQVHATLGAIATHGLVVRTDTSDRETHVIVAADAPPHATHALPGTVHASGEVQEAEVLSAP